MSKLYLIGDNNSELAIETARKALSIAKDVDIIVVEDVSQCERGIKIINEPYIFTAPPRVEIPNYFYQKLGHKRNYKYHK
jgi:hypothetical protein